MERWVQTFRHELLDRTLIWNRAHLLHALRDFEHSYNEHRPHQGIRCPPRSPTLTGSSGSTYEDATGSAASCTNTNMPPDLCGWNCRADFKQQPWSQPTPE